jgi:streptogramin lyase
VAKTLSALLFVFGACTYPPGPNDVTAITGSEGLARADDGTLYYSQANAIGRWRTGFDPEPKFIALGDRYDSVWGLALDGTTLYAGSPSAGEVIAIDLSVDPPAVSALVSNAGEPNGLAVAADHSLFYTDFKGGHVFHVAPDGTRTQVTTALISRPNGISARPTTVLVASFGDGTLVRLGVDHNHRESSREVHARGLGGPDGVLELLNGTTLVSDYSGGRLLRVQDSDHTVSTVRERLNSPANIIFGRTSYEVFVASAGALVVEDAAGR